MQYYYGLFWAYLDTANLILMHRFPFIVMSDSRWSGRRNRLFREIRARSWTRGPRC
jgi:hypothetical protein